MAQAQLRALLDEEGIPPDPPDLSLPVSEEGISPDLPDPSSSDLFFPVSDNPEQTQDSQSDLSQSLLGEYEQGQDGTGLYISLVMDVSRRN